MQKLAVIVVAAALASACGGSSNEGSTSLISSVEATTTKTTVAITQTTVPTTASSTTETTAAEVAFADMERPELEIQTEWETDLDEIFGRYLMYWEALTIAAGPPFADPNYEPLLELLDPGIADTIQTHIQGIADADAVLVVPEDTLGDHGLRLPNPSVLEKTERNRVVIQDCRIQDDITHFLDGRPDIENFKTILFNVDMIVINDEWRVFSVTEADERSDGYQECQDLFDTLEK